MSDENERPQAPAAEVHSSTISTKAHSHSSIIISKAEAEEAAARELVLGGTKKRPIRGQTWNDFFRAVTHLQLSGQGLVGDLDPLKACLNLQVLYVYDNRLTSLAVVGRLRSLTVLYAQNNEVSSLEDFEAPPRLEQLFLHGNRLGGTAVAGLRGAAELRELKLGGQRPSEAAGGEGGAEGGPLPPPRGLSFERESLWSIAMSLRTLDLSGCALADEGLTPLVVLQVLHSLDLSRNALASLELLEELLSRLPQLRSLALAGNGALLASPKWRERLVVASPSLEQIDAKPIARHEREFLRRLSSSRAAKSRARRPSGPSAPHHPAAPPDGPRPATHAAEVGGRRVDVDSRNSHRMRDWEGVPSVQAPGYRPGSGALGHGAAMPGGHRFPYEAGGAA